MVRIHLPINGKYYLWYEVDEERNVNGICLVTRQWHKRLYRKCLKMSENI